MAKAKKPRTRQIYRPVVGLAKLASPVCKALYYISIAGVLLCGILALIIRIVNVPVEDMLLPPLMSVHETEYYSLYIGNGIRIDAAYDAVTLGDIKTVIYAELLLSAAFLCMMAPVSLFVSRLMKNVASGGEYNLKNARYMIYIAMSVAVGYTFVQAAGRFYNYLLVKTFVAQPEAIHLSMGFDPDGIIIGLVITLFAYIYGHTCEKHLAETAACETRTEVVQKDL